MKRRSLIELLLFYRHAASAYLPRRERKRSFLRRLRLDLRCSGRPWKMRPRLREHGLATAKKSDYVLLLLKSDLIRGLFNVCPNLLKLSRESVRNIFKI